MPNHNVEEATNLILNDDGTDQSIESITNSIGSQASPEEIQSIAKSLSTPKFTLEQARDIVLRGSDIFKGEVRTANMIAKADNKAKVLEAKKIQKQNELGGFEEHNGLVSNEGLDTPSGALANIGLSGVSAIVDIVGSAAKAGFSGANALGSIDITQEDLDAYPALKQKVDSGKGIPNEFEQGLLSEDFTAPDGTEINKASKFSRIQDSIERQKVIDAIDFGVKSVDEFLVNDKNTKRALKQVNETSEEAVKLVSDGEVLSGIGTLIGGIVDLAVDEPAAATELTAKSLPQMYLLARNALTTGIPLTAAEYDNALKEFRKEYKRQPTPTEKAIALSYATVSVGLDAVGAKAVLPAKNFLEGLATKLGAKVVTKPGSKAGGKTIDQFVRGVKLAPVKKAAAIAAKPVKATVIEGATEGAQNVLSQLAGTQDISKVNPVTAVADTIVGATSGAQISSTTTGAEVGAEVTSKVLKAVSESIEKTLESNAGNLDKVAETINTKAKDAGIGKADDIIKRAKETSNPTLGIKAITRLDFNKLDKKQRTEKLNNLAEFVIEAETDYLQKENLLTNKSTKKEKDSVEKLKQESLENNKILDNLIQTNLSLNNDVSVRDAVKTVVTPNEEQTDAEIKTATKDIVKDVVTSLNTTPLQANKIKGSTEFKKNASNQEKKIINDYVSYNDSTNKLQGTINDVKNKKNTTNVNDETINGSKDGKFTGVKQYISNMQSAILNKDKAAATTTVQNLQNFLNQKIRHLNNGYIKNGEKREHSVNTKKFITDEIFLIKSAVVQARNMGIAEFGAKNVPKTNIKENSAIINKINTYNTSDSNYNDLISSLKNININKDVIDEDRKIFNTTRNAGEELGMLDTRLNILEEIYEECG